MPKISDWEKARVSETIKRLKLNDHVPLTEARRRVWSQVDNLIADFYRAKARCGTGNNPAAKTKLIDVRKRVREMTNPTAELSAVACWCLLWRNDPQLSRLVG